MLPVVASGTVQSRRATTRMSAKKGHRCGRQFSEPDAVIRLPYSIEIRSGSEQGYLLKAGSESGFFTQREISCLTLGSEF
jgi:hypothetical protein